MPQIIKLNGVTYKLLLEKEDGYKNPQVINVATGKPLSEDKKAKDLLRKFLAAAKIAKATYEAESVFTTHKFIKYVYEKVGKKEIKAEQYSTTRRYFAAMQGQSYEAEHKAGIFKAPVFNKAGRESHHYKRLGDVKKGDVVFSISGQIIRAIDIVKDKAKSTGTERIVDAVYHVLKNELDLNPLKTELSKLCIGISYQPFNINGGGNEGYIFDVNDALRNFLLEKIMDSNPGMDFSFLNEDISDNEEDIDNEGETPMTKYEKITSLNTILYGPPGTGKTYMSKYYAVAICDHDGDINKTLAKYPSYDDLTKRYNELVNLKRIAFTTFHQSYGYEEFIEGMKPLIDEDSEDKKVYYDTVPGVFKKFCEDSKTTTKEFTSLEIDGNSAIWKMSVSGGTTDVLQECFDEDYLRIGFDLDSKDRSMTIFRDKMHKGDIVLLMKSYYEINGIAIIEDEDVVELEDKTEFKFARKVTWIVKNTTENVKEINGGNRLPRPTCSGMSQINRSGVIDLIKKHLTSDTKAPLLPCVFIIDEINRGNISKIFGELITLIEESKRDGNAEAMACTLPYSKQEFNVPNNIYILGTMNTADRSISLMDTALRRRFAFIEMMPEPEVVNVTVLGVDINNMLSKINERIAVLYDREHTIGHAFFTKLTSSSTVDELAGIFKNKIIPLLQEYFYEDYSKIRLVLGDTAKEEKYQFVKEIKNDAKGLFKGKFDADIVAEYRYEIQEEAFKEIESYIQIV